MALPTYASREQLMAATDYKSVSLLSSTIDRALSSASRNIEQQLHRHFYPRTQTLIYRPRWDERGSDATGSFIWLRDDLLSVTTLTVDGGTVSPSDYSLDALEGDSYSKLRYAASVLTIAGIWGYSNQTAPAGALAEALDSSETGVDVTDSSLIGVGDLIKVDSEQMVVTNKSLLDTTADLNDTLAALDSDVTVTVTNGALVKQGEVITVDSERMLVVSIASNDLTVVRAYDGSVLASHSTSASVFAPRTLTVERGSVGTTAAAHDSAAALVRNVPPSPITDLCIAEALTSVEQESSGYSSTVGSGEGKRPAAGKGLGDIRTQAQHYAKLRMAAI